MNAEERLATIYGLIVDSGVPALVMGGHAVRFYGVSRNTFDYDVHFVGVEWEAAGILGEDSLDSRHAVFRGPELAPP
jgi:hypothetical protein